MPQKSPPVTIAVTFGRWCLASICSHEHEAAAMVPPCSGRGRLHGLLEGRVQARLHQGI